MEKTDDLGRRVWNKATYAAQAAKKARKVEKEEPKKKHVSSTADEPADSKALLKHEKRERLLAKAPKDRVWLEERHLDLELEKQIGKVVTAADGEQVGFNCAMCECTLKDSQSYLDHLNGKRHNRLLGMSMRVEKKDVQSVRNKLKMLKGKAHR